MPIWDLLFSEFNLVAYKAWPMTTKGIPVTRIRRYKGMFKAGWFCLETLQYTERPATFISPLSMKQSTFSISGDYLPLSVFFLQRGEVVVLHQKKQIQSFIYLLSSSLIFIWGMG